MRKTRQFLPAYFSPSWCSAFKTEIRQHVIKILLNLDPERGAKPTDLHWFHGWTGPVETACWTGPCWNSPRPMEVSLMSPADQANSEAQELSLFAATCHSYIRLQLASFPGWAEPKTDELIPTSLSSASGMLTIPADQWRDKAADSFPAVSASNQVGATKSRISSTS